MLKKRVIGVVLVREGIAVQSIGFRHFLPIGQPGIVIEYLNRWGIDEVTLLDIDATPRGRPPDFSLVREVSVHGQMPLAVGGGIRDISHIRRIIESGADKVVINSAAGNPALLSEGADRFGSQCIVVSIDARRNPDGGYSSFTSSGMKPTGHSPAEAAEIAEDAGAGEILLTSIDRDGSGKGYDLDLIRSVAEEVRIPVVACGGAGGPDHLLQAMSLGISGAAAANYFNFTEHSVITTKRYLSDHGVDLRLDTHATYPGVRFTARGRVGKLDDSALQGLRFVYIPEEKI